VPPEEGLKYENLDNQVGLVHRKATVDLFPFIVQTKIIVVERQHPAARIVAAQAMLAVEEPKQAETNVMGLEMEMSQMEMYQTATVLVWDQEMQITVTAKCTSIETVMSLCAMTERLHRINVQKGIQREELKVARNVKINESKAINHGDQENRR